MDLQKFNFEFEKKYLLKIKNIKLFNLKKNLKRIEINTINLPNTKINKM